MAQQNDLKNFRFGQKKSSRTVETYKDGAEESLVDENMNIKKKPNTLKLDQTKDALRRWEKPKDPTFHRLKCGNVKDFGRRTPGLHTPGL